MNIQFKSSRAPKRRTSRWTKNYTPEQVLEIRHLIEVHKFPLIEAAEMVSPKNPPKVKAPDMAQLERWIAQRAARAGVAT